MRPLIYISVGTFLDNLPGWMDGGMDGWVDGWMDVYTRIYIQTVTNFIRD